MTQKDKDIIQELFYDLQQEDQDMEDQMNEVEHDLDYTEAGFDYYPF